MALNYEYSTEDFDVRYAAALVDKYMSQAVPQAQTTEELTVDRLTAAFLGTRHTRLAGKPNPESQVLMRAVIRGAMDQGKPIPVLIASGPKKPGRTDAAGQIDIAELSAMRTLCCLQQAVKQNYKPGLSIRIRVEDLTGLYLEGNEMESVVSRYTAGLRSLTRLMCQGDDFITIRSEIVMGGQAMCALADDLYPSFLKAWNGDSAELDQTGWKGGISQEWKDYLEGRHKKLHPELPPEQHAVLSCRYLAILRARTMLGLRGDDPAWRVDGRHLEISFAPELPHAPRVSTRVYYRTMPVGQTKLHVPFWRAKGFFRVEDAEHMRGGLAHANCVGDMRFATGWIVLKGEQDSVRISADIQQ
jgi:hypothetical protein